MLTGSHSRDNTYHVYVYRQKSRKFTIKYKYKTNITVTKNMIGTSVWHEASFDQPKLHMVNSAYAPTEQNKWSESEAIFNCINRCKISRAKN